MRKIQAIVLVAIFIPIALFLGAGWYYSGEIERRAFMANHEPDPVNLRVTSIAEGAITLATTPDAKPDGRWNKSGIWGLAVADSYISRDLHWPIA